MAATSEKSDSLWRKLKSDFRAIRHGKPGRRFLDQYERSRRREGPRGSVWRTAGYVALGLLLVIGGLVLSLPPGVPGFLLWIPGLALLAARSRALAAWLDRCETLGRGLWRRFRRAT
jgi:anti-sigma factor RsiW